MHKSKIFHFIPSLTGAKKFILPCYNNFKNYKYPCTIVYSNNFFENYILSPKPKLSFIKINNFRLSLNIFIMFKTFIKIIILLIKERPKVVVSHFTVGATLSLICAKICCIKHRIYFNHGISFESYAGFFRFILLNIEKINILLSTKVLTVSKGCQKKLKKLSLQKPVELIYNGSAAGLKLRKYNFKNLHKNKRLAKASLGFNSSDIVILYVGRDVPRKGTYEVINIINQLHEEKFKFIIIGFKKNNLIKKFNYNKCKFIKFINKIDNFYKASDFVILPSKHEGFGYSLVEGAAHGSIPLASDTDGPRDIINNHYSGYLININFISKYTKYIKSISANPKLKKAMAYKAYLSVQKYNQNIFIKHYQKYFETLLEN